LHSDLLKAGGQGGYRLSRATPRDTLAVWLVLRAEWKENWRLYDETRPVAWIALRQKYGLDEPPDARKVNTAMLVTRLCHWQDRFSAEAAFNVLSASRADGRRQMEMLLKLLENEDAFSWQQVLEDAAVWNALAD
jgi:hypothetical protein